MWLAHGSMPFFASDKLFVTVNGHMISSALYYCTTRNAGTISLLYPRTTLLWRHNWHDGVSNHQPHGCLLNRLFRRRPKKTSKLRVTGLCVGNSPGPVNSPHEGPVTRKIFPFDDVIMIHLWRNILPVNDDGLFLIKWYPGAMATWHCDVTTWKRLPQHQPLMREFTGGLCAHNRLVFDANIK